jgi:hypothetical protein
MISLNQGIKNHIHEDNNQEERKKKRNKKTDTEWERNQGIAQQATENKTTGKQQASQKKQLFT